MAKIGYHLFTVKVTNIKSKEDIIYDNVYSMSHGWTPEEAIVRGSNPESWLNLFIFGGQEVKIDMLKNYITVCSKGEEGSISTSGGRADVLLRAAMNMLKKTNPALLHTVKYDDAECDAICLVNDIEAYLEYRV